MPRDETEEERRRRKEKEKREGGSRRETEEERAARKEKERREGGGRRETEEERAARKEKERREGGGGRRETEEERAARKERERREGGGGRRETEEERAARKEKEKREGGSRRETEEERAARKEKEKREGGSRRETEEERAARKEKERRDGGRRETEEERAARKEKEKRESGSRRETEEERAARKEKERQEREDRRVVRKALPQATNASPTSGDKKKKEDEPEKKVQARRERRPDEVEDDDNYDANEFDEEFDHDVVAAAQEAVRAENERLRQAEEDRAAAAAGGKAEDKEDDKDKRRDRKSRSKTKEPEYEGQSREGLDAKSLAGSKAKTQFDKDVARATALRRLVDLEETRFVIADIAPQSEYDLFIKNIGSGDSNLAQTSVQAPHEDDVVSLAVQAERVQHKNKGIQAPNDLGLFPERLAAEQSARRTQVAAAAASAKKAGKLEPEEEPEEDDKKKRKSRGVRVDTNALASFLTRSFPVIRALLDENDTERGGGQAEQTNTLPFSSSVVRLEASIATGRRVIATTFSKPAPQYLLAAYGPSDAGASTLPHDAKRSQCFDGLAMLWNVNDPTRPDKVLVTHGEIADVVLSPHRAHLAFAAEKHGAVVVWDMREAETMHGGSAKHMAMRLPSDMTEWQSMDNHTAPIRRVLIAGYNAAMSSSAAKDEQDQLMSMDATGVVHFWMVSDTEHKSTSHTATATVHGSGSANFSHQRRATLSDTDYGRGVNSSMRIFRASTVSASAEILKRLGGEDDGGRGRKKVLSPSSPVPQELLAGPSVHSVCAQDFEVTPTDVSRILVASDQGLLHLSKFSAVTAPGKYAAEAPMPLGVASPVKGGGGFGSVASGPVSSPATTVSCCPTDSRVILVGYANGSVRLFLRDKPEPQWTMQLSKAAGIAQVSWSFNKRWVVFVLDETGAFSVIDLSVANRTEPVARHDFAQSAGPAAAGHAPCEAFAVSKEDRETRLAFGLGGGALEVHLLNDSVFAPPAKRNDHWL